MLLALGEESAHAASEIVAYARDIKSPARSASFETFVAKSFAMLDDHASFGFAWTQAAN